MQCPSCGARLERMNPGIVVAVCAFCSTTLYREGPVLHAGEKSILAEPQSNLRVGSSGFVGDRQIELLGRIQFASSDGDAAWDEWYAVDLANGEKFWLVEDARSYTLERALGPVDLPADFDPSIGRVVEHEGQGFEITEVGDAVCVGGQGHLGRDLRPGAAYRFVDSKLLGATGVLNLEFSPGALTGGAPLGFYGETVHPSAIRFEPVESFDSTPAQTGNAIQCVACGAGFSLRAQGDPVRTATCESCGSQLALSPAGIKVLSRNEGAAMFPFAVGDSMEWTGDRWEVMGRLVYSERDEYGVYLSREYLLWSPKGGYLWLLEYDGHYIVFRPTSAGPPLRSVRLSVRFDTFEVLDSSFKHFERGFQTLHYVDGALPWLARRGDKHEYVDLIAPPRILSLELTGEREQARFIGDYVAPKAIYRAFSTESPAAPPHRCARSPAIARHGCPPLDRLGVCPLRGRQLGHRLQRWPQQSRLQRPDPGGHAPGADPRLRSVRREKGRGRWGAGRDPAVGARHGRSLSGTRARRRGAHSPSARTPPPDGPHREPVPSREQPRVAGAGSGGPGRPAPRRAGHRHLGKSVWSGPILGRSLAADLPCLDCASGPTPRVAPMDPGVSPCAG